MRQDHRMVMTHGDLHPRSIMVSAVEVPLPPNNSIQCACGSTDMCNSEVKVLAIIDWETSGWYPEYWEFVKAVHKLGLDDPLLDWREHLPSSIDVWPMEYALDCQIDRWLCETASTRDQAIKPWQD